MNRLLAAACLVGLAAAASSTAPSAADAAAASTVAEVLRAGRHSWLRWPNLSDVAPALRDLYGGEADGLVWFAGDRPEPGLAGALRALAAAAERGLEPADYDAARIEAEWKRLQTAGTGAAADREPSYPLFVRQKPGPRNSLGLAKFIFPNRDNVYMHGTPAQSLFSRTRRDFSHGCIRLEDPARLAEWVLRDKPGWTADRIEAAMQGERPTQVNLRQPLRVVIFYDTVHVNSDGIVHFVGDIYGHDRALDQALARGYP